MLVAKRLFVGRPRQVPPRQELLDKVRLTISELDHRDRKILLLRHVEELSNGEMAELRGLEIGAAIQRCDMTILSAARQIN